MTARVITKFRFFVCVNIDQSGQSSRRSVNSSVKVTKAAQWPQMEGSPGLGFVYLLRDLRALEKKMEDDGGHIPKSLLSICKRKGFWEDPRAGKSKFLRRDLLPVKVKYNRALYIRLVAHAVIGASRMQDSYLLQKLAQHEFHLIARAAAIRLIKLGGEAGMRLLQSSTAEAIAKGRTESFAFALRDAEIQTLGLAQLW